MSKPHISMILAMDRNRLIGNNNRLPWRLPADLAYFMRVTMGHCVVMGRKTFESFKKPLPGRTNIILTTNKSYTAPDGCVVVHSIEEAMSHITDEEFFVIGGSEIYSLFLANADRLYITHIDGVFEGDAYFPIINKDEWSVVSSVEGIVNEDNPHPHEYKVYEHK